MKFIGEKIYLTYAEMLDCGISSNTLKWAKHHKAKCWDIITDPRDKRKLLVGYDELKDVYRDMVHAMYGNPYEFAAKKPILDLVKTDAKADHFYRKYTYCGGKTLPVETVCKYTRAASWLNMMNHMDTLQVKKVLGIPMEAFYTNVKALIEKEVVKGKMPGYAGTDMLPGDFPGSRQRLTAHAKAFRIEGYEYLVDARFGNKNSAKLGKMAAAKGGTTAGETTACVPVLAAKTGENALLDGVNVPVLGAKTGILAENEAEKGGFVPEIYAQQMAVISHCAALPQNLDAAQVAKMANSIFAQKGWKTVSRATVAQIIKEKKQLLTPGRRGKRTFMDEVAMQVRRKPPVAPMRYWTLDGWTVELMYRDWEADKVVYKRLVAVIVLDPFNKYPIGYAIGDRENTELIKAALKNALAHVRELTGGVFIPLQIQADHFQIKNLTPFFQSVSKLFTPAAVGNAKAKVIEPYNKHLNKTYCQMQANWSGFNVDAEKDNQVNREWLDKVKDSFPDKAGVEAQIHRMFAAERALKGAAFLTAWAAVPETDRLAMSPTDYLLTLGEQLGERTNRVTGAGLIKTLDGVKYHFDSFDPEWRANMHRDWVLIGDRENLETVLAVSGDGTKRFLLTQKRALPMDVHGMTQEDHDELARVRAFNKEMVETVIATNGRNADLARQVAEEVAVLGALTPDQEAGLKLMFTVKGQQKERIQDAKGLGRQRAAVAGPIATAAQCEAVGEYATQQAKRKDTAEERHMAWVMKNLDLSKYSDEALAEL